MEKLEEHRMVDALEERSEQRGRANVHVDSERPQGVSVALEL